MTPTVLAVLIFAAVVLFGVLHYLTRPPAEEVAGDV